MAEPNLQDPAPPADPQVADPPADPAPPADPPKGNDPPKDPPKDDPPKADPKPSFPEDWREQMAGGNEKVLKQLQRFTTPEKAAKALVDLRAKIGSGEYQRKLPDDATDDEKAEWRKENGIPESPDGYEIKLEEGLEFQEADQPLVDSFKAMAHESNLPGESVNSTLNWYFKTVGDMRAAQAEADKAYRQEATDELREAWGNEFRSNINAAKSMFGEFGDDLFNARTPDGKLLGDNPTFMKWAAQVAMELNPAASVMPSGMGDINSVQGELQKIRDYMRRDRPAYNKDTKTQERFMKLLDAEKRLKGA